MPGRGRKRSSNRGRGGHSRGRGRGSFGGGGRGRNRNLVPSTMGYLYQPQSNISDFDDDFRVYAQFGSEESSEDETAFPKHNKKKNKKTAKFRKEPRPPIEYDYDGLENNRFGLGASSSSSAANSRQSEQFAKGKSKYLKKVLFTKSSSSVDLSKASETIVVQEQVTESLSSLTLEDAKDEKEATKQELWNMLKLDKKPSVIETFDYAKLEMASNEPQHQKVTLVENELDSSDGEEDGAARVCIESEDTEDDFEDGEDFDEEYDEDEELNEEDMLIMQDYLENIELEEGEDLNELLAQSLLQNGTFDYESEDLYNYDTLDDPAAAQDSPNDFDIEVEEAVIIKSIKKNKPISKVDESVRKKKSHRTRDDEAIVDPEIFGQSLKAALADVPPGLKPGMRRWMEKQERRENRKQKKAEAKAHKKEKQKKNNNKGKGKEVVPQDISNEMLKIDSRLCEFVEDSTITSFQFAPMETHIRRQLHVLAAVYNLKSISVGAGNARCTVVSKTPMTSIPRDRRYINRFLSDIQNNMNEQNRIIGKNRMKEAKGKKKGGSNKNSGSSTPREKRGPSSTGPSHGTVVGSDAAPIGESNIGHRMLAAMGWRQGEALGSNSEGILAPIEAVIRKKGRGLGS
ncbi:hypothetical protein CU098_004741 [Rhizopus stolonifer]|uniref:Protein SQS1 n=1 Tax=Rhizopus stolonifer TaxID=4846 RepID=A0A367KQV0_RHIST|nr:hypothetical protein CU098_004741 [Rhizopus stolonifer]